MRLEGSGGRPGGKANVALKSGPSIIQPTCRPAIGSRKDEAKTIDWVIVAGCDGGLGIICIKED